MPNYPDPPVHEVILDLRFQRELSAEEVERIPALLGGVWNATRASQVELGPGGNMRFSEVGFARWVSEEQDRCKWITSLSPNSVTLNSVRPGLWPTGEYVGWPAIKNRWANLLRSIRGVYGDQIVRCGLRYINKLAIPDAIGLPSSLNLALNSPAILRGQVNFQLRSAWSSIHGFDGLAAAIVLAKMPVEHLPNADGHSAAMLDIDVFSSKPGSLPEPGVVVEWFERAHAAENEIFESCLADRFRKHMEMGGA